jgi:hypothetical protein
MRSASIGRRALVTSAWLLAGVLSGTAGLGQDAHGVDWLTDLDQARALAAEQGRPLLVVFR